MEPEDKEWVYRYFVQSARMGDPYNPKVEIDLVGYAPFGDEWEPVKMNTVVVAEEGRVIVVVLARRDASRPVKYPM